MSDWRREKTETRVDSFYGPTILAWLKASAKKDPYGLAKPGTIVRVIVEKAFEKAHRPKKASKVTT